jgi:hypothetical protein
MASEETPDMVRGDGLYYYVDNPTERTRYLCLDTGFKGLVTLSDVQAEFIKASLISTPAGWHIVVVAHVWYAPDYDRYSERPVPLAGLSASATSVAAILDNYNSRAGEFADCGGWVEFCIGGHIHYDHVGKTAGGIPIVCCETDSRHTRGTYTATLKTATESAVSGIIADYNADKLTVVRVGRGVSFEVNLSTGGKTDIPGEEPTPDAPDTPTEPDTPTTPPTNVLDIVGYETGVRLNSSGTVTAVADRATTGFINAKTGDTLYFQGVTGTVADAYGCHIAMYDGLQTFISGRSFDIPAGASYATYHEDGNLKSCKITFDNVEWVRFSFVSIDDTSIITVNEPIE